MAQYKVTITIDDPSPNRAGASLEGMVMRVVSAEIQRKGAYQACTIVGQASAKIIFPSCDRCHGKEVS